MLNPTDIAPRQPMKIEPMDRQGISPCTIFILAVMLWLIPLSVWAYATRNHIPADASITAIGPSDRADAGKGQDHSK